MARSALTVLGLDPGIDRLGWAVISEHTEAFSLDRFGLITTTKEADSAVRLAEIVKDVVSLIETFSPDVVYIEKLFFSINAKTAMQVAEVRGALKATIAGQKLPAKEVHPMQLKKQLVGTGKATKKDMQAVIMTLFALEKKPLTDDVVDAIAIAYMGILVEKQQI